MYRVDESGTVIEPVPIFTGPSSIEFTFSEIVLVVEIVLGVAKLPAKVNDPELNIAAFGTPLSEIRMGPLAVGIETLLVPLVMELLD